MIQNKEKNKNKNNNKKTKEIANENYTLFK